MKKITYLLLFMFLFIFQSCNNDDGESSKMTNKVVDISDFTAYVGSPTGGVEIKYNNLRKADLVKFYFGSKYNLTLYNGDYVSIEFNGDKITYTYPITEGSSVYNKIVSGYIFKEDSLFAIKSDRSLMFVALGTQQDNLYHTKGLSYYPLSESRDTVRIHNEVLDLPKMLGYINCSTLLDMTNPKDTIAWCNVKHIFK